MDISSSLHQLREMTEEKCIHLQQIYELTLKQSEALYSEQIKRFVDLSSSKQKIIEKINIIDERFERVYDVVKKYASTGTFSEVFVKQKDLIEIQHTISIIQNLVDQIRSKELENDFLYKKMISEMMTSATKSIASRQEQIARYKKMNNYKKFVR